MSSKCQLDSSHHPTVGWTVGWNMEFCWNRFPQPVHSRFTEIVIVVTNKVWNSGFQNVVPTGTVQSNRQRALLIIRRMYFRSLSMFCGFVDIFAMRF